METKKKKDGRFYLKEKIAKLEAENTALKESVEKAEYEHDNYEGRLANMEKKHQEELDEKNASYVRLKNELNKTIKEQAETINQLTIDKEVANSQYKLYKSLSEEYLDAMGCLRRWWYARTKK